MQTTFGDFSDTYCYAPLLVLPSFPTRLSSDLHHGPVPGPAAAPLGDHQRLRHHAVAHDDGGVDDRRAVQRDRKSTRLNSSHMSISYAVFRWKKKNDYATLKNHNMTVVDFDFID